jgi:NAD(P)-dependent dehydrogenase (short-subunit alcohol dehydrogenase family)
VNNPDRAGRRRVALVTRAGSYVGPALCRQLAASGHDLVLCGHTPDQILSLEGLGATVEAVEEAEAPEASFLAPEGWNLVVGRALDHFGALDAAAVFPPSRPPGFTRGAFLDASVDDLTGMCSYFESTFHALQALIPPLRKQGGGQVVVFTSDAGARPEAGWSLYGSVRAGQNFLVQAVALEHAADSLCINAIGSKNAVFPGFPGTPEGAVTDATVERGDWSAPLEAETPLGRVGTMDELAAFAAVLLDGTNRFQTAQAFSFSGGWNSL